MKQCVTDAQVKKIEKEWDSILSEMKRNLPVYEERFLKAETSDILAEVLKEVKEGMEAVRGFKSEQIFRIKTEYEEVPDVLEKYLEEKEKEYKGVASSYVALYKKCSTKFDLVREEEGPTEYDEGFYNRKSFGNPCENMTKIEKTERMMHGYQYISKKCYKIVLIVFVILSIFVVCSVTKIYTNHAVENAKSAKNMVSGFFYEQNR